MSDNNTPIELLESLVNQNVKEITVDPKDLLKILADFKVLAAENARLKERNEQLFGEANRAELTIQDLRARLRDKK